MRHPLLAPDLRELIVERDDAVLREFFEAHHPADTAELLDDLRPEEALYVLQLLEPRARAETFGYLEPEIQDGIVGLMDRTGVATLLTHMSHDERADLVGRLPQERVERILPLLAHAEREDIRRLVSYEEGTAGAVMTSDYAVLPPDVTAADAINRLRQEAPDRETIYYCYVVDEERRLIGIVSLKDLIVAPAGRKVRDIMQTEVVWARVDEDQEPVARALMEYDLLALPIVDAEGRLVGIVTHDDAADILEQEETEDILRFGGVGGMEAEGDAAPYWAGRIPTVVKRRIIWLLLLLAAATLTSTVIDVFENELHEQLSLMLFIPLLIGTGGNAGSQTVSTVIRGLAIGEIEPAQTPKLIARELLTGGLLGLLLGSVGFLYGLLWTGQHEVALVLGVSILGICVWANLVGSMVPLLAVRVGIDPAVISAPLISTLVDATGLVIYFLVAKFVIGL